MSHHWIPDPLDPEDDKWQPGDYACKHCEQRGNECRKCSGYGTDRPEPQGPGICPECDGEGVIQLTDEEYGHEMYGSVE